MTVEIYIYIYFFLDGWLGEGVWAMEPIAHFQADGQIKLIFFHSWRN